MPDPRSASEAQFLCQISNRELRVVDFTAKEEISSTYEVNLTLASEDEVDFDDVIGKEALLTVLGEEADRYFHGIINEFMQTGRSGRFCLYRATMVPSLWLLSLEQDCRIFQEKSLQDIVTQVLQDAGITSDLFEFRLQGQYDPKEYCVQYRETDLNFISRLLEEEGIFYFFEHFEDKHLLAFGDSTVNYQPIPGEQNDDSQTEVPYHAPDSMVPVTEYAYNVVLSRQIHSGKVTLKDFNFEKPSLDLTAQNQAQSFENLEMYDYPGEYFDENRGSKLAEIRLQESTMLQDKAEGHSTCPRFNPCFTFKLTDHEYENFNQEYLLVEVFHSGSQPQVLEEQAGTGHSSYFNQFLCVPSSITIRPERNTPKPIVEGVQTAIVVGPSGEEIYTDEHGRVKVQFHWDREGKNDENSSCWIRVSQLWAGAGWGAMYIPRIGHEVIVDFIEGDPDRPIITGRVYHGTNTPPYSLPDEKTKSTLKSNTTTGGGTANELLMEDLNGKTQVVLSNAYGHKITEDEETQSLTVETRDKHTIHLDDKNKNISIKTTNAHTILMEDTETEGEGKITVQTTNGHMIEMDDKDKRMSYHTTDGHIILLDDENKKVEITTVSGHTAILDDDKEAIGIASSKGHYITIDDSGDYIVLEDSGGSHRFKIDIGGSTLEIATDSGSINIEAPSGTIKLDATDVEISASNELKMSGGSKGTFDGGIESSVKGVTTTIEGSAMTEVKGALVKIN
ncbi:MAG: type VI secretion system tip protein TssI/VgrG [Thermodesulfobacteriota bacterium]|nr:type VI secretion system tip protein TssI/VgrG [Thermodesulfobacteriota bacterium]